VGEYADVAPNQYRGSPDHVNLVKQNGVHLSRSNPLFSFPRNAIVENANPPRPRDRNASIPAMSIAEQSQIVISLARYERPSLHVLASSVSYGGRSLWAILGQHRKNQLAATKLLTQETHTPPGGEQSAVARAVFHKKPQNIQHKKKNQTTTESRRIAGLQMSEWKPAVRAWRRLHT